MYQAERSCDKLDFINIIKNKKAIGPICISAQSLFSYFFLRFFLFLGINLAFLRRRSFSACSRSCASMIGAISSLTFFFQKVLPAHVWKMRNIPPTAQYNGRAAGEMNEIQIIISGEMYMNNFICLRCSSETNCIDTYAWTK